MTAAAEDLSNSPRRERWRLSDWLAAIDPGLSRLRLASRALLAVFISGVGLAAISLLIHPLPLASYGLMVTISFMGSLAIRDRGRAAQIETRTYAWAAAVACVFVAGLLAPTPLAGDAAFLAIIFLAVYVRRFGQRWFAVGMVSFMSYFMGDYMRAQPADVGWLALSAAVAFSSTQLVTGVLLRDDPERDFRRALRSIDELIEAVLRALLVHPVDGDAMQKQLSRLRDAVMMAEGFIPQGEEGSLAARGAASDLAIALFDLQLMVERMARASRLEPPPKALVRAILARRQPPENETGGAAGQLLLRVSMARRELDEAIGEAPSAAFAENKPAPPAAGGQTKPPAGWQAALQVTLASAVAMGVGELVSPTRWYWAVVTAFIVFNNTKSRGDTLVRALQRSGGTLAGLIAGTLIATLVHGQLVVSAIALPVLFFFALYFVQVSYALMIFLVTVALALLYGLMGTFSPDLLLTRLEETVVGAVAGAGVAFVVFPSRTGENAAVVLEKYLHALRDLVNAARARAGSEPEPLHLLARSRLLDRAYGDLAIAVRPMGGPWGAVTRFGAVRRRLLILSGIAHWARSLARSLPPQPGLSPEQAARIVTLAEELEQKIDRAESARSWFFDRPDTDEAEAIAQRPPLEIAENPDPVFAMDVISTLLSRATPNSRSPSGGGINAAV